MDIKQFEKQPVMGIARAVTEDELPFLARAVIESGLTAIEITMNTPGACRMISLLRKEVTPHACVGAGTVLTSEAARKAHDAGASFIVTPALSIEVAAICRREGLPFFPGALTPAEIWAAWNEGAAMVKVFPARFFGPGYFKEIKGPFDQVKLLACGGVTAANAGEYFSNGASAVAFGASILKREWLCSEHIGRLTDSIRALLASVPRRPH
jgi:2-dehydro-3-deoxyphosphogluconate aldolase/(4S)-4-hydroxy-2-oxoglutarate aldolase